MRLKEFSTEARSALRSAAGGMTASVVMAQSMVAMLGSIMPAPLAIPPMRKDPPGVSTKQAISLGKVSLVIMAFAHFRLWLRPSGVFFKPVSIRETGRGTPIRPVEQTRTCSGWRPVRSAAAAAMRRAVARPASPVQALALPLFKTMAWIFPFLRCSIETRTGAAFTTLVVKVAAAAAGISETIRHRSSRVAWGFLMPLEVAPQRKPAGAAMPPRIFSIIEVLRFPEIRP